MRVLSPILAISFLCSSAASAAPPDLVHRGSAVLDLRSLGADNDRRPEPGETFDLVLTLGNEGAGGARAIVATLRSGDPLLVVQPVPPSVSFPDLVPNQLAASVGAPFRLVAASSIACGKPVALDLDLTYQDDSGAARTVTIRFLLLVGEETVLFDEDFDTGPGGWKQDGANSTAFSGQWVNGAPEPYSVGPEPAEPGRDQTYPDVSCYYTGQSTNAVASGTQVLLSRRYDLAGKTNVWLSYFRWFYTDDAGGADSFTVQASSDDGLSWSEVEKVTARANAWTPVAYRLDTLLPLTATMRLRVIAAEGGAASVCEAAVDGVVISSYLCEVDPAAARLAGRTPTIDDSVDPLCSDRDGIPDAGETFDFAVPVVNEGTAPAVNAKATLATPLPGGLTLVGANPALLGTLADNGGAATATFRLHADSATPCQTSATLAVTLSADPPTTSALASYPLTLEQDVDLPLLRWYDDFDSGLPSWTVITYGAGNDWANQIEDCAKNPGNPPTPAVRFWYTGDTGPITNDCQVTAYGGLDDSAIRSPKIDTGFVKPRLLQLSWNQLLTMTPGDADYAEVWIDHDGDGVFDKIARFEGYVTTNGDLLDKAAIDLTSKPLGVDLSQATRNVQVEFRFLSDANVGDQNALGWIVDDVELTWTDGNGVTCDANVCTLCQANAAIQASKTQACTAESVHLDGSASTLAGCPAPGVPVYAWFRNGAPLMSGPSAIDVQEAVAGSYDYRLDVSCSTLVSCKDSKTQKLLVVDCPNCAATAVIKPAPAETCALVPVVLDATDSTVINCPAPGTLVYQWSRNSVNVPPPLGIAPTYTANESAAGTYSYAVDVSCSTDATCRNQRVQALVVKANGTPLAVGATLKARKKRTDVELTWSDTDPLAVSFNVYRETVKSPPSAPAVPSAGAPYLDVGGVGGAQRYFYRVRAVSCSGIEGPDR